VSYSIARKLQAQGARPSSNSYTTDDFITEELGPLPRVLGEEGEVQKVTFD
jgi:hypothetical protein